MKTTFAAADRIIALALLAGMCLGVVGRTRAEGVGGSLPVEVAINPEAGGGSPLCVRVRLATGEELPFIVDTGSPLTMVDKSLSPKLGKCLNRGTLWMWGVKQRTAVYAAPKMYLGNVRLLTATNVLTYDFKKLSADVGQPVRGILGTDCLKHYCVQMDFAAGKLRFLDPGLVPAASLGKAYPLVFSSIGQEDTNLFRTFIQQGSLIGGAGTNLMVDTGLDIDGAMAPGFLQPQTQHPEPGLIKPMGASTWYFRSAAWEGAIYTNLVVKEAGSEVAGAGANVLGLRFLARHLVTFDFPNRMLYLQRQLAGPLPADRFLAQDAKLNSLVMRNGKLPREINAKLNAELKTAALPWWFRCFGGKLDIKIDGNPGVSHYRVKRHFWHGPWMLTRAWQTGPDGKKVAEFKFP